MKTSPLYYLIFLGVLSLYATCKTEAEPVVATPSFSLKTLEVGQQFRYQEIRADFVSQTGQAPFSRDCYYGDEVLIFHVLEKTTDGFIFKEYLSTQTADEVGEQLLRIADSTVDIEQLEDPSKYGPSLFHLKTFSIASVEEPLVRLEEDCFYPNAQDVQQAANSYAITEAKIKDLSYTNLYAYRYDGGMATDGPGYTYLFSKDAAIIRSTTYGSFFPFLKGWELVPN